MKLSVRLFDKDERAYLAKVLELAGRRSRLPISQSNASQADVIFLRADEPGAHALLDAREQGSNRIVVVYGGDPARHRWTLGKPATSQELLPLLSSLYENLQGPAPVVASQPAGNDAADDRLFPSRHGNHLLERALQLNSAGQPWKCVIAGDLQFFVDPRHKRLYADGHLLQRSELLASQAVQQANPRLQLLSADELALLQQLPSLPLETFCWQLALQAEALCPHELPLLDRRFRLRRWPSFTQLRHNASQISMAGRLMRQSLSIRELTADGGVSLRDAVQFYNCAMACSLIDSLCDAPHAASPAGSSTARPAPAARQQQRSLFSRILHSLSMLGEARVI